MLKLDSSVVFDDTRNHDTKKLDAKEYAQNFA